MAMERCCCLVRCRGRSDPSVVHRRPVSPEIAGRVITSATSDNKVSEQSRRGIAGEQLGVAAVDAEHLEALVPGLIAGVDRSAPTACD
jgi:hypothetical protein